MIEWDVQQYVMIEYVQGRLDFQVTASSSSSALTRFDFFGALVGGGTGILNS